MNPLFPHPDNQQHTSANDGLMLKHQRGQKLQPLQRATEYTEQEPLQPKPTHSQHDDKQAAVNLIRQKLDAIYAEEPNAKKEAAEVEATPIRQRSKHQEFMHRLSTSGKSLAQIQTEWHRYYAQLPDNEKHQVWQEFYEANSRQPNTYAQYIQQHPQPIRPAHTAQNPLHQTPAATYQQPPTSAVVSEHMVPLPPKLPVQRRTTGDAKKQVLRKIREQTRKESKARQHLHSLLFGVSTGTIVVVIALFSFFNEVIIAPFIQPSSHVSATPIILSSSSIASSDTPEVIIPKINVQIPVVYGETSIDEAAVQRALEQGIIHYPTTVVPGQKGNAAFFGHSSNNIFNKGQYKFAFVLLHRLVPGDIFYLTYDKKIYSYKVYKKQIVSPTDTSVLGTVPDKVATATLITCDPPGTSNNRLVVWGEQISPDPSGAAETVTAPTVESQPQELPSNGPSLWKRFTDWLF